MRRRGQVWDGIGQFFKVCLNVFAQYVLEESSLLKLRFLLAFQVEMSKMG